MPSAFAGVSTTLAVTASGKRALVRGIQPVTSFCADDEDHVVRAPA
jgi:hypothetical protein